jgi:nucleotide-binding universal stress UspA family protein
MSGRDKVRAVASYSTVLVGTDGSTSSFRAVDTAAALAADVGAGLLILCAYTPLTSRAERDAAAELGHDAYKVHGSNPAETVLNDAKERAAKAGAGQVRTLAVEGDPVDRLLQAAADESADLIVVGNRGLNSLAGRLLGSVPQNVLHKAPCDVLVIHTTGR